MEYQGQLLRFEATGYLKPGVHDCTWGMLRKLTFTNSHRADLGRKLLRFLRWPLRMGHFPYVYIGGGFISDSPLPQDIDLVLETRRPFGPEAFGAMEPFFSRGLNNILSVYSVDLHFWMEGAPASLADYRSFFQYQRSLKMERLDAQKRGIVRLSLRLEDFPQPLDEEESEESTVKDPEAKSIAGMLPWEARI